MARIATRMDSSMSFFGYLSHFTSRSTNLRYFFLRIYRLSFHYISVRNYSLSKVSRIPSSTIFSFIAGASGDQPNSFLARTVTAELFPVKSLKSISDASLWLNDGYSAYSWPPASCGEMCLTFAVCIFPILLRAAATHDTMSACVTSWSFRI